MNIKCKSLKPLKIRGQALWLDCNWRELSAFSAVQPDLPTPGSSCFHIICPIIANSSTTLRTEILRSLPYPED